MADVDMTDAPPAKTAKSGASEVAGDGKKRFEVKKVRPLMQHRWEPQD